MASAERFAARQKCNRLLGHAAVADYEGNSTLSGLQESRYSVARARALFCCKCKTCSQNALIYVIDCVCEVAEAIC